MSDEAEPPAQPRYPGIANSTPTHWIGGGLLLGFIGGLFLASDDAATFGVLIASVAGLLLTIGAVAKGVVVGIRNARD